MSLAQRAEREDRPRDHLDRHRQRLGKIDRQRQIRGLRPGQRDADLPAVIAGIIERREQPAIVPLAREINPALPEAGSSRLVQSAEALVRMPLSASF